MSGAVPICVPPLRKVTVPPVGVVGPVTLATVAVKVVDCPKTDGFTELASVVVVFSTIMSVALPVAVPFWEQVPLLARTLNVVEPGGVVLEFVLIVRVDVPSLVVLPLAELGLNVALAPGGSEGGV